MAVQPLQRVSLPSLAAEGDAGAATHAREVVGLACKIRGDDRNSAPRARR